MSQNKNNYVEEKGHLGDAFVKYQPVHPYRKINP